MTCTGCRIGIAVIFLGSSKVSRVQAFDMHSLVFAFVRGSPFGDVVRDGAATIGDIVAIVLPCGWSFECFGKFATVVLALDSV